MLIEKVCFETSMNSNYLIVFFTFFLRFSISIATHKKKINDDIPLPYRIPSRYNFLNDYSYCNYFNHNKGCLGDYAQGVFLSFSHRICKKNHKQFKLSYQYLTACDPLNLGCKKGNSQSLMYFLEQKGCPSEEDLPWESILDFNSSYCSKYEDNQTNFYRIVRGSSKILNNAAQIQKDIFLYGPVSASFSDLRIIDDEMIPNDDKSIIQTQTVEIIGWEENEDLFWIIFDEKIGQRYIRSGSNDGLDEINAYSYDVYSTIV